MAESVSMSTLYSFSKSPHCFSGDDPDSESVQHAAGKEPVFHVFTKNGNVNPCFCVFFFLNFSDL